MRSNPDSGVVLTAYSSRRYALPQSGKDLRYRPDQHGTYRRVSSTFRQVLTEFSGFFHVTGTGLLIQTSLGSWGDLGALRTKRSG